MVMFTLKVKVLLLSTTLKPEMFNYCSSANVFYISSIRLLTGDSLACWWYLGAVGLALHRCIMYIIAQLWSLGQRTSRGSHVIAHTNKNLTTISFQGLFPVFQVFFLILGYFQVLEDNYQIPGYFLKSRTHGSAVIIWCCVVSCRFINIPSCLCSVYIVEVLNGR